MSTATKTRLPIGLAVGGVLVFMLGLIVLAAVLGGRQSDCAGAGEAGVGGPPSAQARTAIPANLYPLYLRAQARYGVPWNLLAAINYVETDFGRNLNVSTAGAIGWMQFMPSTWARYRVDGNHDGRQDPYDPADAIPTAARDLRASGAPGDIRGAVFAYNHATWYVSEVLAEATALVQDGQLVAAIDPAASSSALGCGAGAVGPANLNQAVQLSTPRRFATLPAWAMAAGRAPEQVDARLLPDVEWVLRRYDLRVTAAREAGHHTHGDGTATDLVPATGSSQAVWDSTARRLAIDLGWAPACAGSVGVGTAGPLFRLHVAAPGNFGSEDANGLALRGDVPLVAQSDGTAFGILNAQGRPAFALNIEGNQGASNARGVPTFYDRFDGNWRPSLALRNGNVGIGTSNPAQRLAVSGTIAAEQIGEAAAVRGVSRGISNAAIGVLGTGGGEGPGVSGRGQVPAAPGVAFPGPGVDGIAVGTGVVGTHYTPTPFGGTGVFGGTNKGVGVQGRTSSEAALSAGVYGWAVFSPAMGVLGENSAGTGQGVVGMSGTPYSTAGFKTLQYGVLGLAQTGGAVAGLTRSTVFHGVEGRNVGPGSIGAGIAGYVDSASGVAVHGQNDSGAASALAGSFVGNVSITGSVSAASKPFRIDHPLNPADQYLVHVAVESDQMLTNYSGEATTDDEGRATVTLPSYVEALNENFRYQVTAIGQPALVYVEREFESGSLGIRSDRPGVKVSWHLYGVRRDAYARAFPLIVEEDKAQADRGRYLHPEAHGVSAELRLGELRSATTTGEPTPAAATPAEASFAAMVGLQDWSTQE